MKYNHTTNALVNKLRIYPTALNVSIADGYTLEETLKIRNSCLKYFIACYHDEIEALKKLGLFKGTLNSYDESAMRTLDSIFGNDENKQRSYKRKSSNSVIPQHFRCYHRDFLLDLKDLKTLIQNHDRYPGLVQYILKEMRKNFLYLYWMIFYYLQNLDKFK